MKNKRQEAILKLISEEPIDTQETMLIRLRERGFHVTQATVSRDIKDLKLVKNMTDGGVYRYELTARQDTVFPSFNSAVTESITRVDTSGSILVIHTYPGMAPAVAACIDSMKLSSLLGCVAGDDTIIAVTAETHSASEMAYKLRTMIRKI
jgi:transcriptional regulator of arginine metabolism